MVRTIRKNYIKKYRLFFISMCASALLSAGNDEELFLRGNKYYAQEKYDDARACYDEISAKGRAVLYNMGNCLFHMQDYSGALVYWSRAQEGATASEYSLIMHNKELALAALGRKKEVSWWSALIDFLRSQLPYISLLFLQIIFLVCLCLFIFIARSKQVMRLQKTIQAFLCMYIMLIGVLLVHYYAESNTIAAIVVKKDAHLFAGPDKGFHTISSVVYADDVRVKEMREGWYKIQYADKIGWVEADVIQVI